MSNILVPEAQTRAGVAAIRSLGRAGYRVHACSHQPDALGLKSNFAARKILQPAYDAPDYLPWLEDYIARHDIKMIVPSANVLSAVRPRFDDFKRVLPVNPDPATLYKFYSKTEIVACYQAAPAALRLLDHHPDSVIVDLQAAEPRLPRETAFGYFIKFETPLSPAARAAGDDSLQYAATAGDARRILDRARTSWARALVQSGCTGRQVGVSLLMDRGEALAVSCVRDKHLKPHSNGTMSLRESWWSDTIVADAIKRLRYLDWRGCAMLEYRQEDDARFNLIEINARYWQYLHLDIRSGVDFPRYQAEWFLTGKRDFSYHAAPGVVARDTWPGEVAWLVNALREPAGGSPGKLTAVIGFFLRFLRYDDDFNFPGDRMLYVHNFLKYFGSEAAAVRNKLYRKISRRPSRLGKDTL